MRISSESEYLLMKELAEKNPDKFWTKVAREFHWIKPWNSVFSGNFSEGNSRWFDGGQLNISQNCIDRHLPALADKVAFYWEPNNPEETGLKITYRQLHEEVSRVAQMLLDKGIKKGHRVCLYMPMVPELVYGVLACARIGAIHSVVFAGFSFASLAERISDADCSLVLTADGAFRGDKTIPLKSLVDQALDSCPSVHTVIVLKRTGIECTLKPGRDFLWHDALPPRGVTVDPVPMESEDFLFILYTSGSTGKPKGVVHSTGGYMVYAGYSFANVFQYQPEDVFWCTADVGWITGHSYLVYGPLLNGATSVIFEGIPTWPDAGRFWSVVEKYKVSTFYTAPTAIRSLQMFGEENVRKYNRNSLKILGTVGEPINEEAWKWYHDVVGEKRCPIVDTWWQTETGGIMISNLAGVTPAIPSYATKPLPGIQPVLLDESGKEINSYEAEGMLAIRKSWPSVIRTTFGNHKRCVDTYFAPFPGYYFTGDGAKRDKNGNYRITGRVDDVIKVSGHLLGTAEVENAINRHPDVVESAVVGVPHPIKGWSIYAFAICEPGKGSEPEKLINEIRETVSKYMGPIAKPDNIQLVRGLPKTRSGKIMRRILKKIATGDHQNLGDTSTLLDPGVVTEIIQAIT
jgi:acetyl-CoA synthetase